MSEPRAEQPDGWVAVDDDPNQDVVDDALDTITYVLRTEEVYIGSGGPHAELHHLGGGDGFELEWEVDDPKTGRLVGWQHKVCTTRAEAEAFVREHAPQLYISDRVASVQLYPPTKEQLARRAGVDAMLRRDFPGLF